MLSHSNQEQQTNSQETSPTDSSYVSAAPTVSLPEGGGAIRGIGEKFSLNPVTGTGSLSIPIFTSPGRSDFSPELSISYDSGAGNGVFGLGWNLSIPSITRKTDKGLPQYQDAQESDVFILSGAEDLVPVIRPDGTREVLDSPDGEFKIQRYRPRIEGLFARIERWTDVNSGEIHWRSISKDNITTLYGKTTESRIASPDNPQHIFSWLICESYDDKGNVIRYIYKPEDSEGINIALVHECNRTNEIRSANRYLKRIQYGNQIPRKFNEDLSFRKDWLFEVVFDYGEHDSDNPTPNDSGTWSVRNDPFSSYRSTFEVRTYRLCQRVLMFHHFPDEADVGQNCLVRSTDFTYSYEQNPTDIRNPIYSLLLSVKQTGYKRDSQGNYIQKSLPPLEFTYSEPRINETVREVDRGSLENLPQGLDGTRYQWIDLDGEGLSGILTEQDDGWYYKRNLSPINTIQDNGKSHIEANFAPVEQVATKPATGLRNGGRFLDLAGDGQQDLVMLGSPTPGFYERTQDKDWQTFVPFKSLPELDWDNPNLKFIDLNGDGHSDILITEDNCFVWYPSLAEEGFSAAERTYQPWDEEKGPRIVFADSTQSIHLADMSGDGLTDIVRIRNGEVCYWPNLGYGRFGAKVMMGNTPWFDAPDLFNQRWIVLADIDGTGTTDILYLSREGVQVYFNQSGNSWSAKRVLRSFPAIDNVASVTAIDLLGNGTACLVWSSSLLGNAQRVMRYIDLMGGQKPHLLVKTVNNLGAETVVQYAPSTKFYLQDKLAGKPWITKLPFPVHVVERVETYDRISHNRFVTRYAYHHGYFDGVEREFRGFGMVEQWDTEEYNDFQKAGLFDPGTNALEQSLHVPPIHTKTWFHTGVYRDRDHISQLFVEEYYREPGISDQDFAAQLLPDTVLPEGLTLREEYEACRALRGQILRQEVYALDESEKQTHPYTVSERNYVLQLLQPRQDDQYSVFFAHPSETLDYAYERNPADPRVSHQLTLAVDDYGNVTEEAAVAYPRRRSQSSHSQTVLEDQSKVLITLTENWVENRADEAYWYRIGIPIETRVYELTGLALSSERYTLDDLRTGVAVATEIPYEASASPEVVQRRLIEGVRALYYNNDLTAPLPLGEIESLALPYESYRLAFSPGLLEQVYGEKISANAFMDVLRDEGEYRELDGDGYWWIPSGQQIFDPAQFYMATEFRDPFWFANRATYRTRYDTYSLLALETLDPLENKIQVRNNYRTLQPQQITDPNGNRSEVAFDALGMVVGTAIMGKESDNEGDSLAGFEPDLDEAMIQFHLLNPLADSHKILGNATTRLVYDLWAYYRAKDTVPEGPMLGHAPVVYTLARETHVSDLAPGEQSQVQHSFLYSDGFGRELQTKIQAEPGLAPLRDAVTGELIRENGELKLGETNPRWVGTGRTVYNNKGKPVKQYEPFFSATHLYESEADLVEWGVTPIINYDPLERVIRTDLPNGTFSKVEFDAWYQETWDENDTVLESQWYAERGSPDSAGPQPADQEQRAAWLAAKHGNTPGVTHLDVLGRSVLVVADNGIAEDGSVQKYETYTELDIENNQRSVTDALGRAVMVYNYDMLGNVVRQRSMEAGTVWMVNDVAGNPRRQWDSRNHTQRLRYDDLQRPTHVFVEFEDGTEKLVERMVYGETHPAANRNLRGQLYQHYDGAGVVTNQRFDFKGNVLESSRQLAQEYKETVDWSVLSNLTELQAIINVACNQLEPEVFTSRTQYDGLNRPVMMVTPHNNATRPNVIQPRYNEANLLEQVNVWLRQTNAPNDLLDPDTADMNAVVNIDYNAKGQRLLIEYGNQATTLYEYDRETFRLARLLTIRPQFGENENQSVQDLSYTYDPVGNITHIFDHADIQNTIFFRNQRVEPSSSYEYDALYRLIKATGREHLGQTGGNLNSPRQTDHDDAFRTNLAHPHDGNAMGNYTERYDYDSVGNILEMVHQAMSGTWTRHYAYDEASLIEPDKVSNRLSSTSLPGDNPQGPYSATYEYDEHGNMTRMPHLPLMQWDYQDRLQATARQVRNDGGTPEITYYVYDTNGQRIRKVTERQAGEELTPARMKERIYLGDFEIYREFDGNGGVISLERESLHLVDEQKRIALLETRTRGNDGSPAQFLRYQLNNHLGSASLELDKTGRILSYEEYYSFGGTAYQSVQRDREVPLKRYRHSGKERDSESGLYYYGARYYASWLCRWLNCDPSELEDGPNLYVYVANNPIRFWDSYGEFIETAWDVISLGAGVASFVQNVREGNVGAAIVDGVGIALDAAAIVAPGVPGGAGAAIKAYRAADATVDAVKTIKQVDRVTDAAKNVKQAGQVTETVKQTERVTETVRSGKQAAPARNPSPGTTQTTRQTATQATGQTATQAAGQTATQATGKVTEVTAKAGTRDGEDLVDLFRAVSLDEFDDIFKSKMFRPRPGGGSLEAKQFGLNLDETIKLADFFPEAVAVVRARIPRSILGKLDQTPVDSSILRSGSVTAKSGEELDLLNRSLRLVDQAF